MSDCVICYEIRPLRSLICHSSHMVCMDCLTALAETTDACPMCREDTVAVERFRTPLPERVEEDNKVHIVETYFNGSKVDVMIDYEQFDDIGYVNPWRTLISMSDRFTYRGNVMMNQPFTETKKNPKVIRKFIQRTQLQRGARSRVSKNIR